MPNFQYYYWASNIRALLYWINIPNDQIIPKWLSMESASCSHTSLHALLCSRMPLSEPVSTYSLNPIVKHSFKIWSQFRRDISLNEFSIYSTKTKNNMFVPSVADSAFKCWVEKGIRIVNDLFVEDTFVSFDHLRTHFNIPQ